MPEDSTTSNQLSDADTPKAERAKSKGERKQNIIKEAEAILSDESASPAAKLRAQRQLANISARETARAQRIEQDVAGSTPEPVAVELEAGLNDPGRKARRAERKEKRLAGLEKSDHVEQTGKIDRKARRKAARQRRRSRDRVEQSSSEAKGGVAAQRNISRDEKHATRAERSARKNPASEIAQSAEAQKRGEKESARNRNKTPQATGASATKNLRITLAGMDESFAEKLKPRIELQLGVPIEWCNDQRRSEVAIHAFDGLDATGIAASLPQIAKNVSRIHIFLQKIGTAGVDDSVAMENRAIASLAGACKSSVVELKSKFRRYPDSVMIEDSEPTAEGYDSIAASVLGIVAAQGLPQRTFSLPKRLPPPDYSDAQAVASRPEELFAQMHWSGVQAPRLLWATTSKDSLEKFMDRKIVLPDETIFDIATPVAWPTECPRKAQPLLLGLEFLAGPLTYWYSKANGFDRGKMGEIDAVLKERGATASDILFRSGQIILDFIKAHPPLPSAAWNADSIARRARILVLFVLCCKMAAKKKVKFDAAACTEVFRQLLDVIEILRSDDYYLPCSLNGAEQDSLLVGLALVLRGTAYAERLLTDSLVRLKSLQLDPGVTADGVWREGPFSDHAALLSQFKTLFADFPREDIALVEPLASVIKKMTVFAEAVLKSDGTPPAFDNSKPVSFVRQLTHTRRALADAGFSKVAPPKAKGGAMPRMTDTYIFREAQYFISHSTQKPVTDSSLVILHAEPENVVRSDRGGVILAFAYGENDLLIRAKPAKGPDARKSSSRFDPALRNGYHIDGIGYSTEALVEPDAARLVKSWRGQGWAAAKSVDKTNPAGTVVRTIIHLKANHALLVVDQLAAAKDAEVLFEQFWNLAPGLSAPSSGEQLLWFALPAGGLTAAFDPTAEILITAEDDGFNLRRTLVLNAGAVASLFQWSAEPSNATVRIEPDPAGWKSAISGAGFSFYVTLNDDDLQVTPA